MNMPGVQMHALVPHCAKGPTGGVACLLRPANKNYFSFCFSRVWESIKKAPSLARAC
jgi:hypothetical protein